MEGTWIESEDVLRSERFSQKTWVFNPGIPLNLTIILTPQIIECLKENKKQLSTRCHQKVFKLQETEMMDPELDYTLMRVCKQMIKVRGPKPSTKHRVSKNDSMNLFKCQKIHVIFPLPLFIQQRHGSQSGARPGAPAPPGNLQVPGPHPRSAGQTGSGASGLKLPRRY